MSLFGEILLSCDEGDEDCALTPGAIHNNGVAARTATALRTNKCLFLSIPPTSYIHYFPVVKVQPQCQVGRKIQNAFQIQQVAGMSVSTRDMVRKEIPHIRGKIAIQPGP